MSNEEKEHYLFTDFGDVFLGKTAENLKIGEITQVKGINYRVVGDSGTSRQYHEIYLTTDLTKV